MEGKTLGLHTKANYLSRVANPPLGENNTGTLSSPREGAARAQQTIRKRKEKDAGLCRWKDTCETRAATTTAEESHLTLGNLTN